MTIVNEFNDANKGDLPFIEQICSATWEPLYRFIYFKVQNREEAEDITQETYVKTLTYLQDHKNPGENPLGFLKTVAMNILRDRWRQ
ncbi:MAG: sigma factor, partial [Syntrophomonas sp.]